MTRSAGRFRCPRWPVPVVLLAALAACTSPPVHLPPSRSTPPSPGPLRAGAATVDITPPAGLALFGHGPHARVARGHRGRLRCHALVLQRTDRIALVTCDLASISQLLHREVAARTAAAGIGADRLVLSATHTHAGFAHYFGSAAYNSMASSRRSGFDPDVARWTAERIARGVRRAAERARSGGPVRARWGHEPLGHDLTVNRSVCAHCRNRRPMVDGSSTCPDPPEPLPPGDRPPDACERSSAVDPLREVDRTLSVLRVDRLAPGGPRPIAVYAVFPVHATAVPNVNDVYHADLFGFAARYARAELAAQAAPDEPLVVAIANSHEGDVSPHVPSQGFAAARRAGLRLGRAVVDLHGRIGDAGAAGDVSVAYGEAPLPGAAVPALGGAAGGRLCPHAELGTASFGGAEDGRTFMHCMPPWREGRGTRRWTAHCQSPKRPVLFGLSRAMTDEWSLPTAAPMHVIRIGETLLAAVPAEVTTTAGLRLRRALAHRSGAAHVTLIGLANGYMQYVTTAAEYSAQHYEGAATLYGPLSWAFFADRLGQLARALEGEPLGDGWELDRAPARQARPGRPRALWPKASRHRPPPRIVDRGRRRTECGVQLAVSWRAGGPGGMDVTRGPLVRVERRTAQDHWTPVPTALGYPVDDRDGTVEVRGRPVPAGSASDPTARPRHGAWVWTATWTPAQDLPAGTYRFRVRAAGRRLASAPWREPERVEVECWAP